jgi:hypothetical protein
MLRSTDWYLVESKLSSRSFGITHPSVPSSCVRVDPGCLTLDDATERIFLTSLVFPVYNLYRLPVTFVWNAKTTRLTSQRVKIVATHKATKFLEAVPINRNMITPAQQPTSMGSHRLHHFVPRRGFDLRKR